MRNVRKSMAVILAVLMLVCSLPMNIFAAEPEICPICSGTNTDVISGKNPTCIKSGYEAKLYCNDCDKKVAGGDVIPALGHEPKENSFVEKVDPKCDADGSEGYYICKSCGEKIVAETVDEKTTYHVISDEDIVIPATDHDWTAKVEDEKYVALAGTCVDKTLYYVSCSVCGASSEGDISGEDIFLGSVDSSNHKTIVIDKAVSPTCTETGLTAGSHCNACEKAIRAQEEVKALGHTPAEAVEENKVDSTCSKVGSYDSVVYCSVCEAEISRETKEISTKAHSAAEAVKENEVPATCKEEGSYDLVVYCTECSAELKRDTITVEKKAHTEVTDEAVTATCLNTGLTEGKHCSACGEVIVAQEVVEKTGHEFTKEIVDADYLKSEANCASPAVYYKACKICAESSKGSDNEVTFTNGEVDSTNHQSADELEWVATYNVDGNCSKGGTEKKVCACGTVIDERTFSGHSYNKIEAVEPTCTEKGHSLGYDCARCNAVIVAPKEVPSNGHTVVKDAAVAATCTETGRTAGSHCSVCEKVIVAQETVPALGHKEVSVEKVEPTCTEVGYESGLKCSVCGEYLNEGEEIPALGHTSTKTEAKAATCTEAGNIEYYTCSVCEKIYTLTTDGEGNEVETAVTAEETVVPATGHDWDEENAVYSVEPSCDKEGKGTFICKVCEATEERTIPAGHDWVKGETVAATCEKDGYTAYTCSRCDATKNEVNPDDKATGHDWEDEYTTYLEPTCSTYGEKARLCKKCDEGKLYVTLIEMTDHDFIERETPATCTEAGEKINICADCGYTTEPEVIPAIGHKYEVVEGEKATCEKDSTLVEECSVCHDVKVDTAKALGHVDKNKDGRCDNGCGKLMCTCMCHKTGTFDKVIYRIVLFFWDLLGINRVCACGREHYKITHM